MPRKFVKYLQPYNIYTCAECNTHIASLSNLVSKSLLPAQNTTYFFYNTVNLRQGKPYSRRLLSGHSEVVDLYCNVCEDGDEDDGRDGKDGKEGKGREPIGWKYLKVEDLKMGFKEGLSVVEKRYVKKADWITD